VVQAEAFGTGQENGLLPAVLESVRKDFEAIGRADPLCTATVLTDSGYHSEATLRQLADGDINALVADTGFRSRDPRFAEAYRHQPEDQPRKPGERHSKWLQAKHFDYDPAQRTCRCPAGKPLKLSTGNAIIKGRRGVSFEGTKQICGSCPLRTHCLRKPGVSAYRQVTFFDGTKTRETHPHTKAMKARIDTREGRLLYSRRLGIVEPVAGQPAYASAPTIHPAIPKKGRCPVEALLPGPQRAEAARTCAVMSSLESPSARAMVKPRARCASGAQTAMIHPLAIISTIRHAPRGFKNTCDNVMAVSATVFLRARWRL